MIYYLLVLMQIIEILKLKNIAIYYYLVAAMLSEIIVMEMEKVLI